MKLITEKQAKFLGDLLTRLEELFRAREGAEAGEMDFVSWICGIVQKHDPEFRSELRFDNRADLDAWCESISAWAARRLIAALSAVRDRMDTSGRARMKTPAALLRAIWGGARERGIEEETLREMIHEITKGESTSTGRLSYREAMALLDRIHGASAEVVDITTEAQRTQRAARGGQD